MSSTNRGGQRSDADAYCSPLWTVRRLIENSNADHDPDGPRLLEVDGPWLEPGAGEGHIIRAVREFRPELRFTAVDVREECSTLLKRLGNIQVHCPRDFFNWTIRSRQKYTVTITNPPFRLALEFIECAMRVTTHAVIMLLRFNFLGSEKRHPFFREHMPHRAYLLPNRPPFTADGGTDSIEYAWYVWLLDQPPAQRCEVELLDLTPLSERKLG